MTIAMQKHEALWNEPYESNVARWMAFLSHKQPDIYQHCVRVAILADKMAVLFNLKASERRSLVIGCFLHDLGKSFIPHSILTQTEPLSESQWSIIKLHPVVGTELVDTNSGLDKATLDVIRYHHEHWNGKGYPEGLSGDEIPLFARICSVLDSFDAMLSDRPYRKKMTVGEAKGELLLHSGSQFDATIVNLFFGLSDQMLDIYSH